MTFGIMERKKSTDIGRKRAVDWGRFNILKKVLFIPFVFPHRGKSGSLLHFQFYILYKAVLGQYLF